MIRTALLTALLATFTLTSYAQQGRKSSASHAKAADTAGKAAIPVGPVLAGEEKLTAQERAERTFLMPVRKKMPSVQPAAPSAEAAEQKALAIGPPTAAEAEAAEAAAREAAAPRTYHRSSSSRHRSSSSRRSSSRSHSSSKSSRKKSSSASRSSSSRKKSSSAKKSSSKKSSAKKSTAKKSTAKKGRSSSRRRR